MLCLPSSQRHWELIDKPNKFMDNKPKENDESRSYKGKSEKADSKESAPKTPNDSPELDEVKDPYAELEAELSEMMDSDTFSQTTSVESLDYSLDTPAIKKEDPNHVSGFVNIVGRPNVGKSTLSNALVGERLSVITSKAQTTRHRILGIVNGDDFQMIFSDTPGIIHDPKYKLHEQMNRFVQSTFLDADVLLFLTEPGEKYPEDDPVLAKLNGMSQPLFCLINKIDRHPQERIEAAEEYWREKLPNARQRKISALEGTGVPELLASMKVLLPKHPPYFSKEMLTDRPERFFAAEIVREKILLNYRQEIPYSVEVAIEEFKESEDIIRMRALIFANRNTQKSILIGKEGKALKKVGIMAREDMEIFFGKKVYLELFVKVKEGWRDKDSDLRMFGYDG
ncbi:MAG: GTP-binding protein Era [Limisphaerales bacterium]